MASSLDWSGLWRTSSYPALGKWFVKISGATQIGSQWVGGRLNAHGNAGSGAAGFKPGLRGAWERGKRHPGNEEFHVSMRGPDSGSQAGRGVQTEQAAMVMIPLRILITHRLVCDLLADMH